MLDMCQWCVLTYTFRRDGCIFFKVGLFCSASCLLLQKQDVGNSFYATVRFVAVERLPNLPNVQLVFTEPVIGKAMLHLSVSQMAIV